MARALRQNMMVPEQIVWELVRRNALGMRVRRQHVIAGFIVDFYCAAARRVIEIDGSVHETKRHEDAQRDRVLQAMGLRVLHIRNEDVLANRRAALARIKSSIALFAPSPLSRTAGTRR